MLANSDFVAAIIPESFINQNSFRDRLDAVVSLTCRMFDDTEVPVCLALFTPVDKKDYPDDFTIWSGSRNISTYLNLQLHIQLIEHASRCKSCPSLNCKKMKSYLQHGKTCKLKASGGCKICKRIWTLLRIHAQKCKDSVCPIPQCMAIRERIRQLAKQQQAMDDSACCLLIER